MFVSRAIIRLATLSEAEYTRRYNEEVLSNLDALGKDAIILFAGEVGDLLIRVSTLLDGHRKHLILIFLNYLLCPDPNKSLSRDIWVWGSSTRE